MKSKKNKIEFGDKDLITAEYMNMANHKVRVTMWVDAETVTGLKSLALQKKTKYQTLANSLLRDAVEHQFEGMIKKKRA